MVENPVLVVTWSQGHGRSSGLADALDAAELTMPWARAGASLPRSAVGWLRSAWVTWRAVRRLAPGSLVVVVCPPVFALAVVLAAAGPRTRVVADAHSGTFNDPRWTWSHPWLRRLLRRVDLLVVTNAEIAQGWLPAGREPLVLHDPLPEPVAVTPASRVELPVAPYVVFPSSGASDEPVKEVLAAARQLHGNPLVVLTGSAHAGLVGEGLLATGFLPDAEYDALIRGAAAVLALTTREDTMQRAAYEALVRQVPLVCSGTVLLGEVYGAAAVYCAPDGTSIAAAVREAVTTDRRAEAALVRERLRCNVHDGVRQLRQLLPGRSANGVNEGSGKRSRVSIVIDNYNYAAFLPRAVDSALAQTYGDVEVVVVDDGSVDDSLELLRGYGSRIHLVSKDNGGQGSALNAGFTATTGELVLFLDADDELYPEAVERVVAAFAAETAKVHFRLDSVDVDGRPLGFTNPTAHAPLAHGDASVELLRSGRYVTPVMSGNAYPRWVLEQVLPMPENDFRMSADGYLVALAALRGPVVAIEEPLGAYRIHGGNAWAIGEVDAAMLRARIRHDEVRYQAIAADRRRAGHAPIGDLWRRDQSHLRARLALRRLAPPESADNGPRLVWMGMRDACTAPQLRPRQRCAALVWFPLVGLAPRVVATRAIEWLYLPHRRPGAQVSGSRGGGSARKDRRAPEPLTVGHGPRDEGGLSCSSEQQGQQPAELRAAGA